ncbi:hypothetical protein C1637_02890 [Chryseobacterium lactis]|uniref:Glycosyltransferase RgtA/B/C/D-like domain-containing protein n=1 Tax=Chryseobacterium lactis TaxID=1241981 RepID=A0A3G6S085_CHRLC|nr:hypothetical protein EG342_06285 [Chryseobacterium lactis]AZB07310.1 hypothetical protein EG341_22405 [Chryseobacterium lactis]PNW15805.1 hypothetical protein C1637_02890 [Chryseobacterium lactis]
MKTKFIHFLRLVFPSSYTELAIFLFFVTCYGILGSYIAIHYRIIFDNRIPWDAYFSFDNKSILMTGGSFERHPLSYYFFNWVREFSLFISGGKMDSTFRLTLAWLSNIIISLNIIQVYKYVRNIIRLPFNLSLLIILFFGVFSTNILLSFTPENFTYTLFLLSLYNYYAAIKLKKEEKTPALALSLAAISIGGLTITNFVKVFIPVLFEKNLFKNWKKLGSAALRVSIAAICYILLYLNRIDFKYETIFSKTNQQYEKFSNVETMPTWDMILSFFFGGNILFPSFILSDKHNMQGFAFKGLYMDLYSSVFSYLFIGIILILISWSYLKNFKNKWVQVIMISFFIDIVIHCMMRFGLHTSYIYGGHFVFVYPLMLGWLFYAYAGSAKILSFLTVTVSILFVYLLANNWFRMSEFFWFMETYYQ